MFNVGRYIRSVPKEVQEFGENNDFPVFVLPWEVHLVDFNRELCNLIYRSEQEQDVWRVPFSSILPEKEEEYLPVLARGGFMEIPVLRWYVLCAGFRKDRYYQLLLPLLRQCQRVLYKTESDTCSLSSRQVSDSCDGGIPKRDCGSVLDAMKQCAFNSAEGTAMYLAVSEGETLIGNLREKYQTLSYLCRWAADKKQTAPGELSGVTKLLLAVRIRKTMGI